MRGIHRWPVNSPHKGPVTRKMFPFDDVIMTCDHHLNSLIAQGSVWVWALPIRDVVTIQRRLPWARRLPRLIPDCNFTYYIIVIFKMCIFYMKMHQERLKFTTGWPHGQYDLWRLSTCSYVKLLSCLSIPGWNAFIALNYQTTYVIK